jgi:hypothetical protein
MNEHQETLSFHVIPPSQLPTEVQEQVNKQIPSEKSQALLLKKDNKAYVFLTLGQRNTAGYLILVNQVVQTGPKITIHATEITPPKGSFVAQVITHPFVVIALSPKQSVEEVEVVWTKK